MRLFIAVNFDARFREAASSLSGRLCSFMRHARRIPRENMHLTLVFLGEQPEQRLEDIKAAMRAAASKPFLLKSAGVGVFRRTGGDIWWLGFEPCPELSALQASLASELRERGFAVEHRAFKPHLTLLRSALTKEGARPRVDVPRIRRRVGQISLMESRLTPEGAVYRQLWSCRL